MTDPDKNPQSPPASPPPPGPPGPPDPSHPPVAPPVDPPAAPPAGPSAGSPPAAPPIDPPPAAPAGSIPSARRHDLDALRSFAMLLGILLHAALSFIGIPWVVQDVEQVPALGLLVSAIHGFRMPLFFLLSGYFTAMLWQRRGTRGLLVHRGKRIAVPLLLGCVTIVPVMWAIVIVAGVTNATYGVAADDAPDAMAEVEAGPDAVDATEPDTASDLWTAAAYGNLPAVRTLVDRNGIDLDAPDPTYGITALGWATTTGQTAVVQFLLESGVNPVGRYRDRNTPLHTAAFFGRSECAALLLDAGATLDERNQRGETPWDALAHDRGTTEFIANLLQLPIDFEAVQAGRARVEARFAETDRSSGRTPRGERLARQIVQALLWIPFFHHLWFLWFLCWFVLLFVALAAIVPRLQLPSVLVATPLCLVGLVPLTMVTQSFMHFGGDVPGFGPDTSAGLLPMPHVFAHYAIFFLFGALVHATPGAIDRLGRGWPIMLLLACAGLPFALAWALHLPWGTDLVGGDERLRAWGATFGQAIFPWLMIFGLLGLFERWLARDRPRVRYLSDASYWLYLAHLPIIIVGQMVLQDVALPGVLKLVVLVAASMILLLPSYTFLVRYTWIGRLLNGPRTR